jgi:uncharacterized protein (TIGR03437 family)
VSFRRGGARRPSKALLAAALFVFGPAGWCHAPPTLAPRGALRASGNTLLDDAGRRIHLRGVLLPGLNSPDPAPEAEAALNRVTFAVLRYRWNMNAVRLPVSVPLWQRDGQEYLNRVAEVVRLANGEGLVVILAACEDRASGAPADLGLPTPAVADFWRAWAAHFKDNPGLVFSLYQQPSPRHLPGYLPGQRRPEEWQAWLRGGTLAGGERVAGMQDLVDAIRSAGAAQPVSAPAFHDALGFQGLGSGQFLRDPNVLYEFHPYFDLALTDAQRDTSFGVLSARFPVYAGEWGLTLTTDGPGCRQVPRDIPQTIELLFQTLSYFESHEISWTAAAFQPRNLVLDFESYAPTLLDRLWTCGQVLTPQPGMGELILLWLTGDPTGFGAISRDQVASAAGGPPGPVAPGEIISLYGWLFGPETGFQASFDASGRLPTSLGEVEVFFDGVPAPLFYTGPYQINVQVPYSVAGRTRTEVQVRFRGVPSNVAVLDVTPASPEIFTLLGTAEAVALNQDGSINGSARPAAPGDIVVLFATGGGETSPTIETGKPSEPPYPTPILPVALTVGGRPAEVLFAGLAPGFVGLLQVNARLPAEARGRSPVGLTVGQRSSRPGVTLWVR